MPSHVTHSSNSSGKARVYRDDGVRPSRSPSVYSPTSSDSHSSFSSSDHSWTHVSEDEILPSESASHPVRRHQSSRRRATEAPQAPAPPAARHPPSRSAYHHEEEAPRHRSRKSHRYDSHDSHDSRERREHREHRDSRREPSNGSSHSTEELAADDYPFGRHGGPAPYPPVGAYRHGSGPIPSTHGGYPPSMPGAQGYTDPFQHPGALVHRSQHDPFGYPGPGSNPFAPGPPSQNPFSPHGYANPESYFQPDSQHPQMNSQMVQHQRPPGPSHRGSMYGPAPGSVYSGSELVPSPYGFPGGMPPHMMQAYAMHGYSYPPSHHASPPPPATTPAKEEKKEEPAPPPKEVVVEKIVEKKDDAMIEEVAKLRALIKQQEDERIAREKAIEAEALAKKLKAEQEALKKQEIDAASAAAKAEAEKAAEEAAKKAKEEADKKLAEAEAAKAELEKKQKELEEAVEKNKPVPDMQQAPIKFKDAVGRKFSFPWHLCKTWKGMESLIKQAFLHVDVIGLHVQEGHYDLMGPDGEIILPQVWDTMIKPDWEVSMHMWPIPETPKKEKKEKEKPEEVIPLDEHGLPIGDVFAGMTVNDFMRLDPAAQAAEAKAAKKGKKADKAAKAGKRASAHVVEVPPAPPAMGGSPPGATPFASLPVHVQQAMMDQAAAAQQQPMVVDVVDPAPVKKPKKKPQLTGFAAWMAGQQPKPSKKDDEKLERSASSASSMSFSSTNHFNNNSVARHHSNPQSQQTLYAIPIGNGNALARRRRSTAGSSWTTASASGSSPPAKVIAKADQGSCAVM